MRRVDLTGRRFGRLVAIGIVDEQSAHLRWECRCDCGAVTIVRRGNLVSGSSKSCGCLAADNMRRVKAASTTHNLSKTPEYWAWKSMRRRCYVPESHNYQYYGAQGVKVCDLWRNDFERFLKDVGKRPGKGYSLDRWPDKYGDYEPGNVRWATITEQNRNRRPMKPRRRAAASEISRGM